MAAGFLPAVLVDTGDWNELVGASYAVFQQDFIATTPVFLGSPIQVSRSLGAAGKEVSYWHLVTRETAPGSPRGPDPARGCRIPWVRPLIEHYQDVAVTYFMYLEGNGYHRHYFWLRQEAFVAVVEQKGHTMRLVTAFCVDASGKVRDLERRYKNRTA